MYQNWPNQILPVGNFVLSRDGHFSLGSPPPPPPRLKDHPPWGRVIAKGFSSMPCLWVRLGGGWGSTPPTHTHACVENLWGWDASSPPHPPVCLSYRPTPNPAASKGGGGPGGGGVTIINSQLHLYGHTGVLRSGRSP